MRLTALLLSVAVLLAGALGDEEDLTVENDLENDAAQEELKVATEQVQYSPPQLNEDVHFAETFDQGLSRWQKSEAKKDGVDEEIAKYAGEWEVEGAGVASLKGDVGLVLKSKAKHHAIAALLDKPFEFKDTNPFIVQYEVKFQNGMDCGGAYVKLLSKSLDGTLDLKGFTDKTPYTIMFGPDKCGSDNKLHFILRHRNPKTGEITEKHGKKPSSLADLYGDKRTHLFRLTLGSDNSWEVRVDGTIINAGTLLDDMEPPINPAAEIDDPNDVKPEDWDDRKKIPDPDATKPDDWDETEPEKIVDESAQKPDGWLEEEAAMIPDATAAKPDDWDNDMDGEWEAPLVPNPKCSSAPGCGSWSAPQISNPKYKGKWKAPMIDNPSYKGTWKPRRIPNPDFFEDKSPYSNITPIAAIGLELWSMTDGVLFDNFLITDSVAAADSWAETSWNIKRDVELATKAAAEGSSVIDSIKRIAAEKPWLLVAITSVGAVFVFIIVYACCCGKSKVDEAAAAKKTDAPTADDARQEDEVKNEPGASEKEDGSASDAGDAKQSTQRAASAPRTAASESSDDDTRNIGTESSAGEDQSPLRRSARHRSKAPRKET